MPQKEPRQKYVFQYYQSVNHVTDQALKKEQSQQHVKDVRDMDKFECSRVSFLFNKLVQIVMVPAKQLKTHVQIVMALAV